MTEPQHTPHPPQLDCWLAGAHGVYLLCHKAVSIPGLLEQAQMVRFTSLRKSFLTRTQPRKVRPWIDKKKAVTFQLVSRGYADLLSGDPDAPRNVLEHVSGGQGDAHSSAEDDDESGDVIEEPVMSEEDSDEQLGDAAYDYSQHMKQMGSSSVGFSVFVHKNGTIVPTQTVLEPKADAPDGNQRPVPPRPSVNSIGERLGLDSKLFASRSSAAEDEGRFMQKFGNIALDAFADPDDMAELELAMRTAELAEEVDDNLADDFVALANGSDSDTEGFDLDASDADPEFDIDVDDDLPSANLPSVAPSRASRVATEQQLALHEQFRHELTKFDESQSEDSDAGAESDLLSSTLGLEAFEGVLDNFLERQSKTLLDGFENPESGSSSTAIGRRDVVVESSDTDDASSNSAGTGEFIASDDDLELIVVSAPDRYTADDCESVLSTYSNTENHPRLLDATAKPPRIQFSRSGLPREAQPDPESSRPKPKQPKVVRNKDESPEEKRARKQATKLSRRENREQKKQTKTAFRKEELVQKKVESRRTTVVNY